MFKKMLFLLVLGCLVFFMFGCQTVQGIGKDITWLGEATALE